MTNETTASQPKSIGDDAQFVALMHDWDDAEFSEIFEKIVARIEEYFRAPAPQASATIQAAPEDDRALRAGRNMMDYAKRAGWPDDGEGAFEFLQRTFYEAGAATIQEPVMVAEPVMVSLGDTWADSCKVCQQRADFGIATQKGSDGCREAVESGETYCSVHINGALKARAAPMVAGPAGVADERFAFESWAHGKGYNLVRRTDGDKYLSYEPNVAWGGWQARAATVKAVPSEALDRKSMTPMQSEDDADAGIVRQWYFDCDGFYIDVERDDDGRFSIFIRDRNAPKGKKEGWRDQADTDRLNLIESVIKEDGYFYLHNNRARADMGLDVRPGQLREALDALSKRRIAAPLADKTGGGE